MSQLIACNTPRCLLLAADRRVETRGDGSSQIYTAQKLFPLGAHAAVATSGAAVGIDASRELARSLAHSAPRTFDDLDTYSLHVFNQRYNTFKEQGKAWFETHPEAIRLSYILLGGTHDGKADGERMFRFHGSESHEDAYSHIPTVDVLTAPRRIGLEARLAHAARADADADSLREIILAGLRLVEEKEGSVCGPYDIAIFDDQGRRFESVT